MMKFFVKDFCETVQARVVIFGEQLDNDVLYRGICEPAFSCLFFPVFFQFSFCPYFEWWNFSSKINVKLCKLE